MSEATAGITITKPDDKKLRELGVTDWPIWSKEPSTFDWHYDETETCYLLAGEVEVTTSQGKAEFAAGDLVSFPQGLSCTWTVKQHVRKHYRFG